MRTLNTSAIQSELGMTPQGNALDMTPDQIGEYPQNKFKNGRNSHHPESPSRFKLGMYKKNLVLEPPRRNNLTLKWETGCRRANSTDKKPFRAID